MSRLKLTMGYIQPFNDIMKKGGVARTNEGHKAKHKCRWELFSFHFGGTFRLYRLILKTTFNTKA